MNYYWQVTLSLTILVILTRIFPFMMADIMSERMNKLGKLLPAHIMLLLVLYEINIGSFFHSPYAIPAILALVIVLIVQTWLRNTLISIFVGSAVYLGLIHFIF